MLLSKNIRYLRKQRELSQEDLARAIGMKSFSTVQKWEDGSIVPPMKRIQAIAKFFNRTENEILHTNIERMDISANAPFEPTPEERQTVLKFRELPYTAKIMIRAAIEAAYEGLMFDDAERKAGTE